MGTFSERYGYTKPSDIIIREKITKEIQNAICTCYDELVERSKHIYRASYEKMEIYLWTEFLKQRRNNFRMDQIVATSYIENSMNTWYNKLNLIEQSIKFLSTHHKEDCIAFIRRLNHQFERLNFGYRIIDNIIVEISSEIEIAAIETVLKESSDGVKTHLTSALELLAIKPHGDYRNSIKESISAVEFICRKLTGETTLGKAISHLEKNGILIPPDLKKSFEKLYFYTNDATTGIRHALMDEEGKYTPTADEAIFMLITCSAFINYLNKKQI